MPMIRKALSDVTKGDLEDWCSEGWFEDEQMDFKGTIPNKDGEGRDPWRDIGEQESRRIKDYGRDQLLATVVAFANSYGGDLVLGVREVPGTQPGKADRLDPLPSCEDAAHRLSQMSNECIEPPLTGLQVQAVKTDEKGAGIVILRTPRSRLAPHRLSTTKEIYHRVRHETRSMTMRQVQDLTFSVARGLDSIDRHLIELRKLFHEWAAVRDVVSPKKRTAIRLSAVPMDSAVYVDYVHGVDQLRPRERNASVRLRSDRRPYTLHFPYNVYNWRPGLRCSEAETNDSRGRSRSAVFCDGAIRYEMVSDATEDQAITGRDRTYLLYPGWFFALVANAIEACERFREHAGVSSVEYGLEIEIAISHPLLIMRFEDSFVDPAGTLASSVVFPRYVVGPKQQWPSLYMLIYRDFWNAIGLDTSGDEFVLDP